MKIRRTTMAIAAAGALALSACTSDAGDGGGGSEGGDEAAESGDDGGEEASTDTFKPDLGDVTTADDEISYSVGEVVWETYNELTSATYSVYNSVVNERLRSNFWYYGTDGTVYPNEEFGSYEVTSEDPFTVEYTIADEAVWSDGTPITANDYLLSWASSNPTGLFDEETPFDPVSDTFGKYVPEAPTTEVDSKTFSLVYPEVYADWELVLQPVLPSHVVAEQSDMEPAELAQAILDGDTATVTEVSEFWNEGWLVEGELPDPALTPSSGPYTLDGATFNDPEYLTLVPNESYWGTPPATSQLTFRFAAPETQVQALQNGDINIIEPQPTVDTIEQIEGMGDQFTLMTGPTLTWEHFDFNFGETSPFSDDQGGLAAREAFAMCAPRQQIVDNLIAPIDPEAEVMNLREVFPFQEDYDETIEAAYDGRYDEVDIEGAAAKLEEAGLETPVDVRIGYSAPNQRRTDEVTAVKASCDEAGFNIQDAGDPEFFAAGGPLETGDWEIALFAWAGSGQVASGQPI